MFELKAKTEKLQSVKSDASISKCLEYSEYPNELGALLKDFEVSIQFTGIKKHFADDKEERLTGTYTITRTSTNRTISFDFGFSLNDTEMISAFELVNAVKRDRKEFVDGLLYTALACCASDYYIPIDFEDFCSEFSYSEDSIKAKNTWEACLKQSSKLRKIFTEDEINFLPQ